MKRTDFKVGQHLWAVSTKYLTADVEELPITQINTNPKTKWDVKIKRFASEHSLIIGPDGTYLLPLNTADSKIFISQEEANAFHDSIINEQIATLYKTLTASSNYHIVQVNTLFDEFLNLKEPPKFIFNEDKCFKNFAELLMMTLSHSNKEDDPYVFFIDADNCKIQFRWHLKNQYILNQSTFSGSQIENWIKMDILPNADNITKGIIDNSIQATKYENYGI